MNSLCKRLLLVAAVLGAGILAPSHADAAFTLTMNAPNSALSPYTGPYATVEITQVDSNTAHIELTALNNGGWNYLLGDGGILALNVNGAVTIDGATYDKKGNYVSGGFTGSGPFTSDTPKIEKVDSGNVSDFGDFSLVLKNFDGSGYAVSSLVFDITLVSGSWASESAILNTNDDGYRGAVHVFVYNPNNFDKDAVVVTGFSGDGTVAPVPEPTSLTLVAFGALALGGYTWRRRKLPLNSNCA